ncbi:hypothetical protein GCM10027062_28750 [Nocardioides hungaricus]
MPGPEETRLIQALAGTKPGNAGGGAAEWEACATMLDRVANRLDRASMPIPFGEAGAQTAEAMDAAFTRSAEAMRKRAVRLRQGQQALREAEKVMADADAAHQALGPEGSPPTPSNNYDRNTPQGIKEEQDNRAADAAFAAEQERRERIAKRWADQMDTVFADSSGTMREIHGEPPPPPPPDGYSGSAGGVSAPSGSGGGVPTGGVPTGGGGNGNGGGGNDGRGNGGGGGGGDGGTTPTLGGGGGSPQGTPLTPYDPNALGGTTSPVGGPSGGVGPAAGLGVAGAAGGAAAGGIIGAGLTAGGVRAGVGPVVASPGTATSGVRGIGATSRTGMSGALGRPAGTSGVGAAGSGTAARSGSAARSGAGARGAASAGSRGAAGSRGTGARAAAAGGGASGRGARGSDKERRGKDDPFEAPEDWVGEDEASPAILD